MSDASIPDPATTSREDSRDTSHEGSRENSPEASPETSAELAPEPSPDVSPDASRGLANELPHEGSRDVSHEDSRKASPQRTQSLTELTLPDDEWTRLALARGMPPAIAMKLPHLPDGPGVYLWKDVTGAVLYVGKAKRLRSRVRSYWSQDHDASPKTRGLLRKTHDLETIVVPSEAHALILEATLIKEHHPRFNIALRDDKSYPYIKVTVQEPFPRVLVTRRLQDDRARYFGPYTDVGAMRRALNVVKRIFTVRSCHYDLPREAPERPCLDYFIKRCQAPCVGYQSEASYREMIDEVVWFLEGRTGDVVRHVRERMLDASERLDFERAGELRDALRHLEKMEEPTVVLAVEGGDRDVVGYARDGEDACVVVLRIRQGKLLAREHRLLEHTEGESDAAVLEASLTQWYRTAEARARDLLRAVRLRRSRSLGRPTRADANSRAATRVASGTGRPGRPKCPSPAGGFQAGRVSKPMNGPSIPSMNCSANWDSRIYRVHWCASISHMRKARTSWPVPSGLRTVDPNGRSIANSKLRRSTATTISNRCTTSSRDFSRVASSEEKPLPDLAVIDGGKGQLSAAHAALDTLGLKQMAVISLAKREEEIFLPGRSDPVRLPRRSPALRMVQQARDEAHRFAVTFQRAKRAARTITSELLSITGCWSSKTARVAASLWQFARRQGRATRRDRSGPRV